MSRTQQEEQNDHECELAAWELLEEAKATADLWIQKAKEAEQAAADLKAEVEDWKKEYTAERALADRLAEILQRIANEDYRGNRPHHCVVAYYGVKAWKEARSE